jgi:hypothetical protein
MRLRTVILGLFCIVCLAATGCSRRPGADAAGKAFERLKPGVKVLKAEQVEDEVAARTFRVTFTPAGEGQGQNSDAAYLLYFTESGEWQISKTKPQPKN